jgi:hypothetical protein
MQDAPVTDAVELRSFRNLRSVSRKGTVASDVSSSRKKSGLVTLSGEETARDTDSPMSHHSGKKRTSSADSFPDRVVSKFTGPTGYVNSRWETFEQRAIHCTSIINQLTAPPQCNLALRHHHITSQR